MIFKIDSELLASLSAKGVAPSTAVIPDNTAWVIFTSGSTGVPKGVVLKHAALCTTLQAHGAAFGIDHATRAAQFAAYTFHVSISDIFAVLHRGGCVCVLSEDSRMNSLTEALQVLEVNYVNLTPTVVRLLNPADTPLIKTVVVGGEPLDPNIVKEWAGRANVINSYGPSECGIISASCGPVKEPHQASIIRYPMGTRLWVTANSDQLCPIGAPGELLIEGPNLARGYLNDTAKTMAAFITKPKFMENLDVMPGSRFYRTGDLVRQNRNGSLTFLGRRDAQVKIRGQRVEIGEIEHWIQKYLTDARIVMVLICDRGQESQHTSLVAAVEFTKESTHLASFIKDCGTPLIGSFLPPTDRLREAFGHVQKSLFEVLPAYIVPRMYIAVIQMPLNPSGKLDRRAMREAIQAIDIKTIQQYTSVEERAAASSRTEQKPQVLWSEVLGISIELVGANDHFFQIGGDSVAAMRLVAAARHAAGQLRMTVADIFQNPQLSKLAQVLDNRAIAELDKAESAPFELWKETSGLEPEGINERLNQIATQCNLTGSQIEDIYSCTPLKEGFMAITSRQPTAYILRQVFPLADTVNVARFREAWQTLIRSAPIFRTRTLFGQQAESFQVVVRDTPPWRHSSSLETYLDEDRATPMGPGQPLNRFGMIEQSTGERFFIWTAHHSTHDGWSMNLALQQVASIYLSNIVPLSVPYTRFIRYLGKMDTENAKIYWHEQFQGDVIADYPSLPSTHYQPRPRQRVHQKFVLHERASREEMMSDVLRASWALILAQHAGHDNSVFAVALSGRDAPVADILDLMAPTITTVPLHVRIDRA